MFDPRKYCIISLISRVGDIDAVKEKAEEVMAALQVV